MADNKSPPEPQAGDPMYGDDPMALSEKEKAEIRDKVKKRIIAEARKTAKEKFEEMEEKRLRFEEGMQADGVEGEMITITLDLAEHSGKLSTNGRDFWHGHTYTLPRHVVRDLSWRQYMGWRHQLEIEGKSESQFRGQYRINHMEEVKGRVVRA
jgi:hypothetical protein